MKAVKDFLVYYPGGETNENSGNTAGDQDEKADDAELSESDFAVDEEDDATGSDENLEKELREEVKNDKEEA